MIALLSLLGCTDKDAGPTSGSRPPAPEVQITEDADGALTCSLIDELVDPDGDAVALRFAWLADSGFTATGERVAPADAARGGTWTCTATASDAEGDGPPGTATWTASGPVPRQYAFQRVMNLSYPSDLVALDDGTLLVSTLVGEIQRVDPNSGEVLASLVVADPEEELLSLALDPRFGDGEHDHLYFWTSQSCRLGRVSLDLDAFTATDAVDVRSYECTMGGGHSSGDLLFWQGETEDPALYLALGPAGSLEPQDDSDDGQGLFAFDVDPETGEASPALAGPFANPAQVATGLRNPWRLIDCGPRLCLGDPGHAGFEEINLYAGPGDNFGAGEAEGPDPNGTYVDPSFYWEHDDPAFVEDDHDGGGELRFVKVPMLGVRVSATGYSGRLDGVVLYGDLYDGWIRGFTLADDGAPSESVPLAHRRHVMAMAETPDGVVYAIELGGSLQRLVLRGDLPTVGEVGSALSETSWPEGGIDFDVRYPLWSNGADKERMIQLPEGESIDVSDPDEWRYPVGTRLWKTFSMDGERVETRLLERAEDGWVPGVYLWEGDDAYLSDGTRQELVLSGGTYTVPSLESCAFCHEATPGEEWPIGPEPFQLGEDGLAAFAPLLSEPVVEVPEVAGETDADTIALRGALHGNCAFCHNPDGLVAAISEVDIDLSYGAESTGLVGERVNYYHDLTPYGPASEYLVVAGDPDQSVLLEILENTDMPPVGVWREDTELTDALRRWILGL